MNIFQTHTSIAKLSSSYVVHSNVTDTNLTELIPPKQRSKLLKTKSKQPTSKINLQNNLHSSWPISFDLREKPLNDKQMNDYSSKMSNSRKKKSRDSHSMYNRIHIQSMDHTNIFESNEENTRVMSKKKLTENIQKCIKSWYLKNGLIKECFVKLTPISKSRLYERKIIKNYTIPIENITSSQSALNSTSLNVNFDSYSNKVNRTLSDHRHFNRRHRQLTVDKHTLHKSNIKRTITSKEDMKPRLKLRRKINTLDNISSCTSAKYRLRNHCKVTEKSSKDSTTEVLKQKILPVIIDDDILPKNTITLSSVQKYPVDIKIPIGNETAKYNDANSTKKNHTIVSRPDIRSEMLKRINRKISMTDSYAKIRDSQIHDYQCNNKANQNILYNKKSNIAYDMPSIADNDNFKVKEKSGLISKRKKALTNSDVKGIEETLSKADAAWKKYSKLTAFLQEDANNNNNDNNNNKFRNKECTNFIEDVSNNNNKCTRLMKTVIKSKRNSEFQKLPSEADTKKVMNSTKKHVPITMNDYIQSNKLAGSSTSQTSNLLTNFKSVKKSNNDNIIATSNFNETENIQRKLLSEFSNVKRNICDADGSKESRKLHVKTDSKQALQSMTNCHSIIDNCVRSDNDQIYLNQDNKYKNTVFTFSERDNYCDHNIAAISENPSSRKRKLIQQTENAHTTLTIQKKMKLDKRHWQMKDLSNKSNHDDFSSSANTFTHLLDKLNTNMETQNRVSHCTVTQFHNTNRISITPPTESVNTLNIDLNNCDSITQQNLSVNKDQRKLKSNICSNVSPPTLELNNCNYGQSDVNGNNDFKGAAENISERTDSLCSSGIQKQTEHCTFFSPSRFFNESTEQIVNNTQENIHESSTNDRKECNENSIENNVEITVPSNAAATEDNTSNNTNEYDDEDDDCISLFAESLSMDMYESDTQYNSSVLNKSVASESNDEHLYYLTNDKNFDKYLDKNKNECEKDLRFFLEKKNVPRVTLLRENHTNFPKIPQTTSTNSTLTDDITEFIAPSCDSITASLTDLRSNTERNSPSYTKYIQNTDKFFFGHCFTELRRGICFKQNCVFLHDLDAVMKCHLAQSQQIVLNLIDSALSTKFRFYLRQIYPPLLKQMNCNNIIKLFGKMYDAKLMNMKLVNDTVKALLKEKLPLFAIVTELTNLLEENDAISEYILEAVKHEIPRGYCWSILRKIFTERIPSTFYIEIILRECIETKNMCQIKDVYENLMTKLDLHQLSKIDINLITAFNNLYENVNACITNNTNTNNSPVSPKDTNISTSLTMRFHDNDEGQKSIRPTHLLGIAQHFDSCLNDHTKTTHTDQDSSLESCAITYPLNAHETNNSVNTLALCPIVPNKNIDKPLNIKSQSSLNCEQNGSSTNNSTLSSPNHSYFVNPTDNSLIPSTQTQYQQFQCNFNTDINNITEGLKHNNYEHIVDILKNYSGRNENLFVNNMYHLLCKEKIQAEHHLTNIIQFSVRTGTNVVLGKMLFTLGTYVLTNLADTGSWVLAYELLKSIQICCSQSSASFILLSTEIYLANQRPLKALTILQQSKVIFTNRKNWYVINNANDEYLRMKIVSFLLEMLCENVEEHAFSLFEFLTEDQTSIYQPIDLSHYVNKVALGLLRRKQNDLILRMSKLIIHHNFIVQAQIHRAIIICAAHSDIVLARQLYQYATWFGLYYPIKFNFPIHVLINCHWSKEEMYLTMLEFVKKFLINIGHAIDHLHPTQLSVYLIFEIMPRKEQIHSSKFYNKYAIQASKVSVKNILQEKFSPSIKIIKKEQGKLAKLNSRSLIDYLKLNID